MTPIERPQQPANGRYWCYQSVIATMAGPAAERRACRGTNGWKPLLDREQLISYHEAAHTVAFYLAGTFVYEASILEESTLRIGRRGEMHSRGHVRTGRTPNPPKEFRRDEPSDLDLRWSVKLCSLLAPSYDWKSILATARTLRAHAESFVSENWELVCVVAGELLHHKELNQEQLERIFKGSAGVAAVDSPSIGSVRTGEYHRAAQLLCTADAAESLR